jgi:hypothetical protein
MDVAGRYSRDFYQHADRLLRDEVELSRNPGDVRLAERVEGWRRAMRDLERAESR